MSRDKPGHWSSIFGSFDLRFYPRILNQSFGRSIVYLLLLSFVISLLLSARYTLSLSKFAIEAKRWTATHINEIWPKGLSEIKIENGLVSSPVAQPFTYQWAEFFFLLDTTGKITSLNDYKQGILITKNKMIFKTKKSEAETDIREYDFSKVESFIIRQGNLAQGKIAEIISKGKSYIINTSLLKYWLRLFYGIAFCIMSSWFFFYFLSAKIAQGLIFSLFALLANKILKANLKYNGLLNVAFYALTPATIIAVIVMLLGAKLRMFWFLYCLIYGTYLILGIKNARENVDDTQTAVPSQKEKDNA